MLIKCNIGRQGSTDIEHGGRLYVFDIQPGKTGNETDKVCEVSAARAIERFLSADGLFEEWKSDEAAEVEPELSDCRYSGDHNCQGCGVNDGDFHLATCDGLAVILERDEFELPPHRQAKPRKKTVQTETVQTETPQIVPNIENNGPQADIIDTPAADTPAADTPAADTPDLF